MVGQAENTGVQLSQCASSPSTPIECSHGRSGVSAQLGW